MQSFSFRLLIVSVTFFIGVFAVSVWMFENQAEFTKVSVTNPAIEEKQSDLVPVFNPHEDYEVYSAILANKKGDDEVLLIRENTLIDLISDAKNLGRENSILTDDLIRDFDTKSEKKHKLQNNFSIENKAVLITEKEETINLFAKYPKASAIFTFSRVGFNKDRTQSLVFSAYLCGPLCGRGEFILLQKVSGKWTIEREIVTSIS